MKKALSVFLSLLMVITTISVVFTIPASAAGNTVYVVNENFDSLPEGEITTNTEVPSGNGWIKLMPNLNSNTSSYKGTVLNPQTYADIDYATGGFTAASPNNVIRFGNWQAYGYVFDVQPNTTYTVNAKTLAFENTNKTQYGKNQDHNTRISAVDITGATGKLVKTGSGNGTAVQDATTQFSNKMAYSNVALTTGSNVVNQWEDRTLTFTTAPSTTKMVLLFTIEHNSFKVNVDDGNGGTVQQTIQYAGVDNGFLMDDLVVTCEAKPTVKAVTYGADTKNGGEAWVVTNVSGDVSVGANITYKARPYDTALFDGFYSVVGETETKITEGVTQNADGSYVLENRPWSTSEKIIAKFEALTQNVWPQPSFEGYKSVTTGADITVAANLLYRGGGKNYDHQADYNREVLQYTYVEGTTSVVYRAPSKDNWSATSYGRVAIIDAARVSSVGGTTPYSGKQVMTFGNKNGHGSYKVIEGLDKNTTYTLSYWVYYDATGSFNTTNDASKIVGAPTDENGEVVYTYMNDGSINVTAQYGGGQTTLTQTAILNNSEGLTNTWVKYERTFNTGDFSAVLVPFYPGSAANFVYVDHVSLYKDPETTTPTVNSVSNFGSNDGIVYNITDAYYEGDTFSATAMPYGNATFTGFYVDDKLVSSVKNDDGSYTATLTYDSTKTYTAKFSALKANIWPEDPAPSSTTPLYKGSGRPSNDIREIGANGWTGQSWATIYNVDNDYIATLGTGLKAYAGDTALYFSSHNGHNAYKVVRGLKTNTQYTLTYWVYHNGIDINGATVTGDPTRNDLENNTGVNYGITGIGTGATMIEVHDMYVKTDASCTTYPQVRPTQSTVAKTPVAGEWFRVERTFNTGANTDFLINFGNCASTIVMYDHVALFETPIAIKPTIIIDDNGMNAGIVENVTEVYGEGEEFTATVKAYDNATFDGWYVGEEKKSSETTWTFTYDEDNAPIAKFIAQYPNLFTDGSFESYTAVPNAIPNGNGTGVLVWGKWDSTVQTPTQDGWIGTKYGRGYIADDTFLSTLSEGAIAYSGNKALVHHTGSHEIGRIINVEPNTQYNLVYYSYLRSDKALGATKIFGLDSTNDGTIVLSGDEVATGTNGQTNLNATDVSFDNRTLNTWIRQEHTFNSGNNEKILITWDLSGSHNLFIDHVSLFEVPVAFAPTVTVDDGGKNAGIVYDVTKVFKDGDTFSATAKAYDNGTFLGWYVGDVLVSTDLTYEFLTYDSTKTYTAKFSANYPNIFPDSSFENQNVLAEGSKIEVDLSFTPQPSGSDTTTQIGTDGWTVGRYGGVNFLYGNTSYKYGDATVTVPNAYTGNVVFRNLAAWSESYRILAVEPNTQYIFTAMVYETTEDTRFNAYDGSSHKVRGITDAEYEAGAVNLIGAGQNSLATTNYLATTKTHTKKVGDWAKYTVEFNSGSFNYIALPFSHCDGSVFIDDAVLYEIPVAVDLDSKVQIDSGEYSNAGLVDVEGEVFFDGDTFTISATPYANATLDGLYINGEKVDGGVVNNLTTTYEVEYAEGSTYVVKFNAFAENIFPDASFEGITPSTSTYYIPGAGAGVLNGENPILANGWISSVYGHAYVANSEQLAGKGFENVKAYVGNNVLFTDCPSHTVFRLVDVEANSTYKMVYYVYAKSDSTVNVNNLYGIKPEGDTVTWADMNPKHGGETGQTQIPVTVNDYAAAADQWVRREVTFNTGAHTRMLLTFGSKNVLFDHVTVYRLPDPTTVSIGVAGGNLLVNGNYVNSASYEVGEQVTVTAEPYANTGNTFLGWYTDASCTGEAFSTDATLSVTATDGGTYYAKFKNNNLVADAGFENIALGEITSQGATTGFYASNAKLYVTDTVTNHDDLSAYAGNKMLKVNSTGGTAYYTVGAVQPHTSYIVSFKVLLPEEGQEVTDWRQGAPKIVSFAGVRSIDARIGEFKDIVAINGNQYESETDKITYHTISEGENGTWKQVTAIVNSYEFDELRIGFGYYGTTSTSVDISMYIDDFTVVEAINATASVETLNPFGDEVSAQVGGYAYAKNSYTQAALPGSGEATKVTLVATPHNGGVFLGWYNGETQVSTETTFECEVTEATHFVAKFAYNGFEDIINSAENLLTFDGSFEDCETGKEVIKIKQPIGYEDEEQKVGIYHPTSGEPIFNRGSDFYTLGSFSEWGRIYATSRYAYDGNNSLYLNANCNASFIMKLGESGTETALETNTQYVASFYYLIPKAADYDGNGNPDYYIQQIGIVEEGFGLKGTAGVADYFASKADANGKKLLYGAYHQGETAYGEWTKVEIPFTTTAETAGATLVLTCIAGTKNSEQRIYIDNFELKKAEVYDVAVNTAFNNSVERGGVAIRLPDAEGTVTQALRFKARIAKERLEAMTLGADYKVVEYGSLAMNSAYIEGDSLVEKANNLAMTLDEDGNKVTYTNGGKNAVIGVTYNANSGANKVFAYKPGERDLIFTAALTGIGKGMEGDNLAKAYTTTYVVRTYAILELADGTKVVVHDDVTADETFQASIYDVALKAMDDPKVSDVDQEYIQKHIIDVCKAASEEGVASSYSSSFTGKGLSNEEEIENMFVDENIFISGDQGGHVNSAPAFYTSDNTIRVYKENTLTLTAQNSSAYSLRNTGLVRIIKSVEITYKSSNVDGGDADPTATANVGTVTYSEEENKLTISDINASEVVITFNGKAKITNIKVNYTEQAPCAEHVYTDNCDEACDNCYAVRNDAPHNFASDCDAVCDCGETREATGEHTYRFVCSTECSVCGATREADHVYNEGFCECGAKEPTEKTVSVVVEDYASANSWANGTKYTSVIIAKNSNEETIVSATASGKSASGDTGKYYTSGKDWRFYQTDDSKLTITAAAGYIVKSVKVTYSNSNSGVLLNGTEQAASGDVVLVNAQSITLKVGNKGTATNGQARITAIEVVYDIIPECAPEDHVYDNSCDTSCNVCNAQRAATHEDDAVKCDTTCSVCGEAVVATAQHTADACASACELCSAEVVPTHKFAGDCDAVCECGLERDVDAEHNYVDGACDVCGALEPVSCTHEYDNACDAECNLCFATREDITHTYISECDTTCEYCDATREAAEHETYDNACDTTCICGAERVAPHNFTNDCQTKCADCDVTREPLVDHTWTDDCDAACDVCGETRTAPHQWHGDCDEECNLCKIKRTATGTHNYVDGVCSVCDAKKPDKTTVNVLISDYASAKNWSNSSQYLTINLDDNVTATATGKTNSGKYYSEGGQWRLYESEAATLTIVAVEGQIIKTVKVTYTAYNNGTLTLNGSNVASGTPIEVNAASITFGVSRVSGSSNGQARITAIEVVYGEACKHDNDQIKCDTICSECNMTVVPTAEHTYADDCDANCDVCDTVRTAPHVTASDCDLVCNNCGADLVPTAEHTYDDDSDVDCNLCGDVRVPPASCVHEYDNNCDAGCNLCDHVRADEELEHTFTYDCQAKCDFCDAANPAPAEHDFKFVCSTECSVCGVIREADHDFTNGDCQCGEPAPEAPAEQTLAQFTLGENGEAKHADGSSKTSYTETVNGITLNLTGGTNMYTGARDAKGNGAIKLGTGTNSKTGGFSFTVGENVTKVIIYVAKYKTYTTKVIINDTTYTLTKSSNDGEYDAIEIDTTTKKTVTLISVASSQRAMVNGIDFVGTPA